MKSALIIFGIIIVFISCNKETGEANLSKVISSSQIDTIIISVDTLRYSLGSFDKQDGITFVKKPGHAKLFEMIGIDQEQKKLIYRPQNNYLGVDSILMISKRTTLGENSFVKLDSVLFVIRIVKNDFHKKLIGKWYLKMMCGGFAGTCDSIGLGARKMEFGYNMDYIETIKDSIVKKRNYYLIDSLGFQYVCINDIFNNTIKYKRHLKYNVGYLDERFGDGHYIYYPLKNN